MAEWKNHAAYKPNAEWDGHTFYYVIGGKWVRQDAFLPSEETQPTNCLTFSSAEPFTIGVSNATKNWDGTLEYSTDGVTWSEWDGTAAVASAEHAGEQRIFMRGSGNSKITGTSSNYKWVLTGSGISCIGNIENLLDYETVANGEHPTMANYCYCSMFYGCASLIAAPELPATTLAAYCYNSMFYGCTNLTTAPELPATTLVNNCYHYMFRNCTSLTTAPALPATTLAIECYYSMFRGCTSLTTAPKLPATTLTSYCYCSMFYGCTSLATVPELPATALTYYCYNGMFSGCTSIKLSTTQSDEYPNAYRIPTSGTGTTATNALATMFKNTGGTFTGAPTINTTYYTSNTVV